MKIYLFLSFCFLGLYISPYPGCSQAMDSTRQKPVQSAMARYQEAVGDESHLYNGRQYVNYDKYYIEGHQFFRTDEPAPANIYYDGVLYTQTPILYDLMLDKIVLEHPSSEFLFSLIDEKVKSFTLLEHTFIRLQKDSLSNSPLKTGYYDLLHNGPVQFLAKRSKNLQEQATLEGMKGQFEQNTRYYIQKENIYYPVKNKASVLKALPDKKKELQQYAREQKLKFRKNREKSMLEMARYYNKITT